MNPRFSDKFPAGQRIENVSTASGSECYVSSAAELAVLGPGEAPLLRSEKPVIKRSVIGAKSVIGQKTKIINSLLMDGCVVGAGYAKNFSHIFPVFMFPGAYNFII